MADMSAEVSKVLSGQSNSGRGLLFAGIFVAIWFAMDLAQFIDWAQQKFSPAPVLCQQAQSTASMPLTLAMALR